MFLEEESQNTVENALFSLQLLASSKEKHSRRLILVTSEFHMPRSFYIFQAVAAHLGLDRALDISMRSAPSGLSPPELQQRLARELGSLHQVKPGCCHPRAVTACLTACRE